MAHAGTSREDGVSRWIALAESEADPAARVTVYDQALASMGAGEPRLGSIHLNRALALDETGRTEAALDALRRAASCDVSSPLVPLARGAILARSGRLEEALRYFDAAIERDTDLFEAHYDRGVLLLELGRPETAIRALDRALAIDSGSDQARIARAQAMASAGRFADARTELTELGNAGDPEACALAGLCALALGDPSEAYGWFDSVQESARHAALLRNLGHACRANDDLEEAVTAYARALDRDATDEDARSGLALTLTRLGRGEEALVVLQSRPRATHVESVVLFSLGRDQEALEAARRAIASDPPAAASLAWSARLLATLGRLDESLEACERALAIDPRSFLGLMCRTDVLFQNNRLEEALESADRLVDAAPGFSLSYVARARVLHALQDSEEALAAIDRALELELKNALAHRLRGDILVELQRLDDALVAYKAAVRCDPTYASPHVGIGLVLERKKKAKEALAAYEKAAELDPADANTAVKVGRLLQQLDRLDEAERWLVRALELDPSLDAARTALEEVRAARVPAASGPPPRLPGRDPEVLCRQAEEVANAGDATKALDLAEQALRLDPNRAETRLTKAVLLQGAGRWKEALGEVLAARATSPRKKAIEQRSGLLLKTIEKDLMNRSKEAPRDLRLLLDLAEFRKQIGRLDRAQSACHAALQLDPMSIPALRLLGSILTELGDLDGALDLYERAAAIDPVAGDSPERYDLIEKVGDAQLRLESALALHVEGRNQAALRQVREVLALLPLRAEAHILHGHVLYAMGEYTMAMKAYDAAVHASPTNADAHYWRGNMLFGLGQLETALQAYETALRLDPRHDPARKNHSALHTMLLRA